MTDPERAEALPATPESTPQRLRLRRTLVAVVAAVGVATIVWGASGREPSATASAADRSRDAPHQDGSLIRFSEGFAKRAGLSVKAARVDTMSPVVNVNGTLTFDARRFAAVGARIAGRVRAVHKLEGDEVRAGEVLAELESAELGRAESQALAARARERAAEAEMKRERHLADARITAERDAEAARATYEAVRAERIAAERGVQALGGSLRGELGVLLLRSPIAGQVIEANASRGQMLEPSTTLFEVADLDSLWVELHVFERDIEGVRQGDLVEITPQGQTQTITGRVAHVGDVIAVDTRTADVRVEVPNTARGLRPGQSVRARIHTTAPASRRLVLPRQAVTRVDGKPMVFVSLDAHTVEARQVTLGPEDAARIAVTDGLKEGEKVVVGGMFALKSELFR
jgi:membrane fusion protein, heavy metal efflux system